MGYVCEVSIKKQPGNMEWMALPVMDKDGISRCRSYDTPDSMYKNRSYLRDVFLRYDNMLENEHHFISSYMEKISSAENVNLPRKTSDVPMRQGAGVTEPDVQKGVQFGL